MTASVNIDFHCMGKKSLSALHPFLCSEESLTCLDHEDEYMMAELYLFSIMLFNLPY